MFEKKIKEDVNLAQLFLELYEENLKGWLKKKSSAMHEGRLWREDQDIKDHNTLCDDKIHFLLPITKTVADIVESFIVDASGIIADCNKDLDSKNTSFLDLLKLLTTMIATELNKGIFFTLDLKNVKYDDPFDNGDESLIFLSSMISCRGYRIKPKETWTLLQTLKSLIEKTKNPDHKKSLPALCETLEKYIDPVVSKEKIWQLSSSKTDADSQPSYPITSDEFQFLKKAWVDYSKQIKEDSLEKFYAHFGDWIQTIIDSLTYNGEIKSIDGGILIDSIKNYCKEKIFSNSNCYLRIENSITVVYASS